MSSSDSTSRTRRTPQRDRAGSPRRRDYVGRTHVVAAELVAGRRRAAGRSTTAWSRGSLIALSRELDRRPRPTRASRPGSRGTTSRRRPSPSAPPSITTPVSQCSASCLLDPVAARHLRRHRPHRAPRPVAVQRRPLSRRADGCRTSASRSGCARRARRSVLDALDRAEVVAALVLGDDVAVAALHLDARTPPQAVLVVAAHSQPLAPMQPDLAARDHVAVDDVAAPADERDRLDVAVADGEPVAALPGDARGRDHHVAGRAARDRDALERRAVAARARPPTRAARVDHDAAPRPRRAASRPRAPTSGNVSSVVATRPATSTTSPGRARRRADRAERARCAPSRRRRPGSARGAGAERDARSASRTGGGRPRGASTTHARRRSRGTSSVVARRRRHRASTPAQRRRSAARAPTTRSNACTTSPVRVYQCAPSPGNVEARRAVDRVGVRAHPLPRLAQQARLVSGTCRRRSGPTFSNRLPPLATVSTSIATISRGGEEVVDALVAVHAERVAEPAAQLPRPVGRHGGHVVLEGDEVGVATRRSGR